MFRSQPGGCPACKCPAMTPDRIFDAHLHLWDPAQLAYPWLQEVPAIDRAFGLADYATATAGLPVAGMVFVQCECAPAQYEAEIALVEAAARQDARLQGMVAWAPLDQPDAGAALARLAAHPLVRGVRRLEETPSLYARPAVAAQVARLGGLGLTFDLCLHAAQLPAAVALARACPETPLMLDHLGKPDIRGGAYHDWAAHMRELAALPHVWVKLSGLVTEADHTRWQPADLRPYVETALALFGPERVCFGGDWPVVRLAGDYRRWVEALAGLTADLDAAARDALFYGNARRFYGVGG